jgi:Na+/H+ antiporter NhaD/arsenite permease-like protein
VRKLRTPPERLARRNTILASHDPVRVATWGLALGLAAATLLARREGLMEAAATTWQPFLTLAAVIAAGLTVDAVGFFRSVARLLGGAPDWLASAGVLGLTALLSGAINLDVAVVVAVPLALELARDRRWDGGRRAVAVALTANATSFLIPTSNITTLLVLQQVPLSPGRFAQDSWLAWLLVSALTVGALAAYLARRPGRSVVPMRGAPGPGMDGTAALTSRALALLDLVPLFVAAAAIRAMLAGAVSPGGGLLPELIQAILLAAGVNNLPAAAAVSAVGATGRWTAVLGLAIGPNLVLSGSLASLVARRLARNAGARFGAAEFSAVGAAMLPAQLALAVAGLGITGALGVHLTGL